MELIICGDLFLGGDLEKITHEYEPVLSATFASSDFRLANLESPICDGENPANKSTIYASYAAIHRLKQLNISAVSLANNHIHDLGNQGIFETIRALKEAKIGFFGAGRNLNEASKEYWIDNHYCILGFCDHEQEYLKQVQIATPNSPGVNPLNAAHIYRTLEQLPKNARAILFFHWGREHVWLPPSHDIRLAKTLLEHDKVALIVGSHSHRLQGVVNHNRKQAFPSLGNFLFPNFFMIPPTQMLPPGSSVPPGHDISRIYHEIKRPTQKKWSIANRISVMLKVSLGDEVSTSIVPTFQKDNYPLVSETPLVASLFVGLLFRSVSVFYCLRPSLYRAFQIYENALSEVPRKISLMRYYLKEFGANWVLKKIVDRLCRVVGEKYKKDIN